MNAFTPDRLHGQAHSTMPDLRYISMEGPDGHLVGFVRAEVFDEVTRLLLADTSESADAVEGKE